MANAQTPVGHQFHQVPIGQLIAHAPAHTQNDDLVVEPAAVEERIESNGASPCHEANPAEKAAPSELGNEKHLLYPHNQVSLWMVGYSEVGSFLPRG
jgi:hypothetical protein